MSTNDEKLNYSTIVISAAAIAISLMTFHKNGGFDRMKHYVTSLTKPSVSEPAIAPYSRDTETPSIGPSVPHDDIRQRDRSIDRSI